MCFSIVSNMWNTSVLLYAHTFLTYPPTDRQTDRVGAYCLPSSPQYPYSVTQCTALKKCKGKADIVQQLGACLTKKEKHKLNLICWITIAKSFISIQVLFLHFFWIQPRDVPQQLKQVWGKNEVVSEIDMLLNILHLMRKSKKNKWEIRQKCLTFYL